MERTGFENLRVYHLAEEIGDLAWKTVSHWSAFAKNTVGKQLVTAADSMGANLAEGSGRGSYVENRRYARIAGGSLFEVKHWLRQAYKRNLLTNSEIEAFQMLVEELTPRLSAYINSISKKAKNQ